MDIQSGIDAAEDACRVRPVPKWATHFMDEPTWTGDHLLLVNRYEEIEK